MPRRFTPTTLSTIPIFIGWLIFALVLAADRAGHPLPQGFIALVFVAAPPMAGSVLCAFLARSPGAVAAANVVGCIAAQLIYAVAPFGRRVTENHISFGAHVEFVTLVVVGVLLSAVSCGIGCSLADHLRRKHGQR